MNIYSWNVNGIRAAQKKGFIEMLKTSEEIDMIAIQETKAQPDQLDQELLEIDGFHSFFMSAEKKGYSGTALYTKIEPLSVEALGIHEFDSEGRVLIAEFDKFTLINCYFPNSQNGGKRLDYKISFCDAVLEKCQKLIEAGKNIVLCGDYNIAHTPIDLARPKQNEKNAGYLPEEREWMSKFIDAGFVDSFRIFNSEGGHYSWWSYRAGARQKNIGWRIDYHCVNSSFSDQISGAEIHPDVMGSDHCPVSITLK